MKQAFAIGFILIHLVYLGGYQLIFDQLEKSANESMISRLDDAEYSSEELIEVKIPINIPYQVSNAGFERFDGEVEVDGQHYNYVQRKVINDTLVLLCIPNTEKTGITTARETFLSLVNDINNASEGKSVPAPAKLLKFSVSDFDTVGESGVASFNEPVGTFPAAISEHNLYNVFIEGDIQPPETLV